MTTEALHDPLLRHLLLWLSALCGGALNAVAGGGSFFTFPVLILLGVPPIVANATSTVALWPGGVASAVAYRRELGRRRAGLIALSLASLAGGGLGAWLLLWSGDVTFARLVPWLLLTATVLFAASGPLVARLRAADRPALPPNRWILGAIVQLAIAVYGGYFGGGMGILMLAAFALSGMPDVHEANARKSWLGALINGVAVVTFIAAGKVRWAEALIMVVGAIMGGYGGAALARRIDPAPVRRFVVGAGLVLTVVFFLR
jgi:hypothetical protein